MRRRLRRREHGSERLHPRRDATVDMMTIGAGVDALVPGSVRPLRLRVPIAAGGNALLSFF
jgi:hypothetical protein